MEVSDQKTPRPLDRENKLWFAFIRRLDGPQWTSVGATAGVDVLEKRRISYPYRDSNP